MKSNFVMKLLAATACAGLAVTPALARKANTLTDLNGARGSSAESELQDRGFEYATGNKNSMGYVYSYWWHTADKNCVIVEVYEGKVTSISDVQDQDCGHHKGGDAAAVAGVAVGAALLGALLSHKSHHHEDGQHSADQQAEVDYERGYTDGLHGAPYHNTNRSDGYSSGYTAGNDERTANLSHHHGHGGYVQVAEYKDLKGARAAGAMDEFERRGFVQVDNFASGNSRYSIQWRKESHQCLQAIISDGHIYDVTDIHTHPNCR